MSARVLARFVPALVLVLAAACGGEEQEPQQPLAPPPVSPNLTVIHQGSYEGSIPANEIANFSPSGIAGQQGVRTACEKLVFLFSWRTADKKQVEFVGVKADKSSVVIVKGSDGVASVDGCVVLGAANRGNSNVQLELRFVLAETR